MRVKLLVSYDGTEYSGWQVQPNAISIQENVEKAVLLATGEKVRVTGSGRTDAGVHAQGQIAHFDTNSSIPADKFFKALNVHLPRDIRVIKSESAPSDFHACNNAKKKTYEYSFYISSVEQPLKERYAVKLDKLPDIDKMKECAKSFIGEHDFKGFCASGSSAKTTVRTIYNLDVTSDGQTLTFSVTGNGFLYNMVRILVGTLIDVGNGKTEIEQVKEMIKTGERKLGGKTLPAKGLCLKNVEY